MIRNQLVVDSAEPTGLEPAGSASHHTMSDSKGPRNFSPL